MAVRLKRLKFCLLLLVFGATLLIRLIGNVTGQGEADHEIATAWSNPSQMALKKVSNLTSAQAHPNFLSNLDCWLLTYRHSNSDTMQTGCYTPTAFGYLDSDSEEVIFNGTDESLPLQAFSAHEVLVPWPRAGALLALDPAPTDGMYLSLYRYPTGVLEDQRNYLGQLTGKRLTAAPELGLYDMHGQRLVVNAQTLAFSDSGSWLVAETLTGYFVRINLATLDIVPFAKAFAALGIPGQFKSDVTITGNGRYIAINNEADNSLNVYDLANCTSTQASPSVCPHYNYRPFVKSQLPGLAAIHSVRFISDELLSFEVQSTEPNQSGSYVLSPQAQITALTGYLGLGDSFTSGEGAFNYRAGTDTETNQCHVSVGSYPMLLSKDLFSTSGGHSVACSGATISDVGNTDGRYTGQVRDGPSYLELKTTQSSLLATVSLNYIPGYLAQHRFVQQYQPAVITVSVGGDDIGFGDILATCLLPHFTRHASDNTCFNTYEDRLEVVNEINKTVHPWQQLFKQLAHESPFTTIFVVGYPDIIDDHGSCGLNVQLNQSEREFAKELAVYINDALQRAAKAAGVHYVNISSALAGHRLCEASAGAIAVNGVTAGQDIGLLGINFFGKESYHPNALGHQLIEQEILRQTHNLSVPSPPVNSDTTKILNQPKSGRATITKHHASLTEKKAVNRGGKIHVSLNGAKSGLRAHSLYSVKLSGSSQPLGSLITDETGNIDGEVILPVTAPPGGQVISVGGNDQTGSPVSVEEPIYVVDLPNDWDGDGISNNTDSCPTIVNSGVDADQDGTDDACDGSITTPAVPSNSSNNDSNTSTGGTPSGTTGINQPNSGLPISVASSAIQVARLTSSASSVKPIATIRTVAAGMPLKSPHVTAIQLPKATTIAAKPRSLPIIAWWRWLVLLIILWFVLLLIYLLLKQVGKNRLNHKHYVQIAN